jgi:arylsulfatase B
MLRRDEVTLANLLQDRGYRTSMIGKWHLGDNYPYRPHDRGFDEAFYHGGGGVGQTPDVWNNAYFDGSYYRSGEAEPVEGYVTDVFFDEAMRFIDSVKDGDRPFFLYLSTNAPHGPMHAPLRYAEQYADFGLNVNVQHFLGMISNIDDNVGRLRSHLDESGLAENTILIFTTDNGSSSGTGVYTAGMRGKKGSEYDGGHRVPLFVHWPGGELRHGHDISDLTAHVDLVPTVLELTGTGMPEDLRLDGTSLVPLLKTGVTNWPERTLITDSQRVLDPIKWRRATVMTDRWRQINGVELYDMDADAGQQNDVSAEYPGVMARLTESYENWWAELEPTFAEPTSIVLGHPMANPVRLTSHDWLGTNAQVPWNQRHIRALEREADGRHKGFWSVEIASAGTYEFDLRRWPEEAGLAIVSPATREDDVPGQKAFRTANGIAFPAVRARLQIGVADLWKDVTADDEFVRFNAELDAGTAALIATFSDVDGNELGAYYVTVNRINDENGVGK